MTRNWHNPAPTPAELAAWADGELDPVTASRVEAWLADHPEAAHDAESARRLVQLYRDHAPPEPSPAAWQAALGRIETGLAAPRRLPGWRLRLLLGFAAAAAVLGGLLIAGLYRPRPAQEPETAPVVQREVVLAEDDDNDEPFAVLTAGEVDILSMEAVDADRLVLGQPLLGPIDFCRLEDIQVVKVEADPEEGLVSRLQPGPEMPMIVVARADEEEP